jgi:ABC-type uncharacterized transport system substrate-binding protein
MPASGGIFVLEPASIFRGRELIAQLATENRLPTSFAFREYVEVGGLVSYGVNFSKMYRRAAEYTDKILHGAKPADLPVSPFFGTRPASGSAAVIVASATAFAMTAHQSRSSRR